MAAKTGYVMAELFRISKGREFQIIGAATENCETQNLCGHGERVVSWSQKSVNYELEHNVSVMSGDKQAVGDAGDLELDAPLDG